ncbi:MAG: type VI secretion system lipoprotein TssJ [Aromatoleum sp.]|jgi:type VI secretion system protein VasD|uniref:type VI secretion system lipoprotein TssJ n=1 Tax=Aromatoleum sp. TaxID=2307007 RepID=UPI002893D19A|nr:type VI secretion system lipoprotein TssJ [Aromatoleum sp.]MDT3669936.1 type VI secretion system lipoprotein TssJ [Aromatoleum sp.]
MSPVAAPPVFRTVMPPVAAFVLAPRERFRRVLKTARGVAILAAVVAVGGCATKPPSLQINVVAAPTINRDVDGEPLSMVVRLYQLKDRSAFDLLTFDAAARVEDDRELFGDQLVSRRELLLVPGGSRSEVETLAPEARYLGIAGLFREPDSQHWRVLVDAQAISAKGLRFRVDDCHLTLLEPAALAIPGQQPGHKPRCRPAASRG